MKANISCTKKTIPCVINGVLYKWYPDIKEEDIGTETSNKFIDTFSMSNLYLSGAGADYDGDQVTVKAVYTEEANDEIEKYMNSKAQYIGLNGTNGRVPEKEAIQAMYNMTLILPDDLSKITPSEKILF